MSEYYGLILRSFRGKVDLSELKEESHSNILELSRKISLVKLNMGIAYFVIFVFLLIKILS